MVCGSHLVPSAAADASRAGLGLEFALHMADTATARIFNQVDRRTLLRPLYLPAYVRPFALRPLEVSLIAVQPLTGFATAVGGFQNAEKRKNV
jgi:hypothetical protein